MPILMLDSDVIQRFVLASFPDVIAHEWLCGREIIERSYGACMAAHLAGETHQTAIAPFKLVFIDLTDVT